MLVYAEEFHSETGAHAKRLESWKHWAARVGLKPHQMASEEAKDELKRFAQKIVAEHSDIPKLPWMKK
jgi:pyrroloquinoline quinone (PQQ) biosynthesis protein C